MPKEINNDKKKTSIKAPEVPKKARKKRKRKGDPEFRRRAERDVEKYFKEIRKEF